MNHGGKRKGAGSPSHYTFEERLAIANAVTLVQRQRHVSISRALEILREEGSPLPGSPIALRRYLTPKYLNREIVKILQSHDRVGLLTLIRPVRMHVKKSAT